jgi:YfiH family protein
LIRWETPGPYTVAFSTRAGGVSDGAFASLNLGLLTDDAPENVAENRRRLCDEVGADAGRLAMNRQVHGSLVHRAEPGKRGEPGDGLWTDEPGVPMLAVVADCLPVAVARVDGGPPALAVLHVGRMGLLEGIIDKTVAIVGNASAVIGPGIGPCCYEVGDEVAAPYRARFGEKVLQGRHLDLWGAAETVLRDAGVESVERVDLCTACNPDLFFSHRRDRGVTGRQGVIGYVA